MRPATIRTLALLAAIVASPAAPAQTPPALPAPAERPPNTNDRQEFPYWSRAALWTAQVGTVTNVDIAYDARGITHVVWQEGHSIYYANDAEETRSASGFSTKFQLVAGQFTPANPNGDDPHLAVAPDGTVYVIWVSSYEDPTTFRIFQNIAYRKREPALGWQPQQVITNSDHVHNTQQNDYHIYYDPDIAADSTGGVHVVYIEEFQQIENFGSGGTCQTGIAHITYTVFYRLNFGATATVYTSLQDLCNSPPTPPLATGVYPVRIALEDRPTPGNPGVQIITPNVVWTTVAETTLDGPVTYAAMANSAPGGTWGSAQTLSPSQCVNPDVAIDPNGVVHYCYVVSSQPSPPFLEDTLLYKNSTAPMVEEPPFPGAGSRIPEPRLAVDSRGQPQVAMTRDGAFRHAGRVLGTWKASKGYTYSLAPTFGSRVNLVNTPNDQLIATSSINLFRTIDPDLGEQDAFAMFDVGPNASTNVANGNLVFSAPLFSSRGVGISTNFSLIYNSLGFGPSPISQGWQHNYDIVLTDHNVDTQGNSPPCVGSTPSYISDFVSVRFGDGRVVEFKRTSQGIYLANNEVSTCLEGRLAKYGHFSKVEKGSPTIYSRNDPTKSAYYLMTGKFGLEFLFDANGRLVSLIDTNKNILTLTQQQQGTSLEGNPVVRLQTITDSANRATGLIYYGNGQLQKITDPALRTYTLTYSTDTVPKLMSVSIDATSDVWSFSHHAANDAANGYRQNLLALVRTPRGQAADPKYGTTFLYYQDNRFARSIDPPALHVKEDDTEATFAAWRTVAYTNPVPTGTIGADDEYWTAAFTDRRNFTTTAHYQYFRSIATKVVDPLSKKIVRTFDPDFRNVMNFKDKRGNSTVFTYATTTGFVKDNVETIARPDAPAIAYTYTTASGGDKNLNRVETIQDSRANTTTYEYFLENGNLKKINFPAAPDPCHQDYTYDSKGRVLTSKSPNGFTTDFNYDPQLGGQDVGLVGKIERPGPNGGKLKPEFLSYEKMGITTKRAMPEQPAHPTTFIPDGRDRITDVIDPVLAQSHNDFDPNSNLTDSKDPRQFANALLGKTHHDYDNLDRLFKTTNAQNHFAETKYDPNGNVRESRDFDGNISKFKYDELNRTIREERHNLGSPVLVMTFHYDNNGNLDTETQDGVAGGGAGTKVTTNAYDKRNNRVRTVMNGTTDGTQIDIAQFDANDNLKVSMRRMVAPGGDPNDMATYPGVFTSGSAFDYDQRNRMTLQTDLTADPGSDPNLPPTIQGTQTSFAYDCDNNRTSVTSGIAGGGGCQRTTTFGFDETDRLTSTLGPTSGSGQSEVHYTYDDNGNRKTVQVDNPIGGGLITAQTFNYNDRNELESSLDAFSNSGSSTFDLNGNLLVRTDEENFKTGMVYDSLNRLVETRVAKTAGQDPLVAPDSAVVRTQFQYDFNGNRTAIIDPRGFQYDFEYDGLNRLAKVKNPLITGEPSRHEESYTYDEFGNRKSFTDANGKYEEMAYDELNRLKTDTHWTDATKTTQIVQIARTYDASNNLLTIDDGTTKLVYIYTTAADAPQPINLVKQVSWLIGGTAFKSVSYTYDACGKRATLTEPEGALVRYTYDGADRLEQILRTAPADIERLFMTMTYDKGGRRKTTAYGNSTTMSYGYDLKSRLVKLQLETNSGGVLSSFGYSYDKRDNRTQTVLEHKSAMFSYGYDALSRLTSETCTGTSGTAPSYGGNTFASLPEYVLKSVRL